MANILPGDDISSDLFPQIKSFGKVGALGDIFFEVSRGHVRTFDNLKREFKARFAEHNIIGRQPVLEFLGPNLREVTFDISFNRHLGVNPKTEAAKLRDLCEKGSAEYLVIGIEVVGLFVVMSVEEKLKVVDSLGNIVLSEVAVKLKEYGGSKWKLI